MLAGPNNLYSFDSLNAIDRMCGGRLWHFAHGAARVLIVAESMGLTNGVPFMHSSKIYRCALASDALALSLLA